MVKIRLRRMGARNRPYYRIVVSDSRLTARAEVLEELGSYDPVVNPPVLAFDRERAKHWIAKGALVSPTVKSLLERPETAPAA
jgi:small subunit ribosomal protein S16